jgi:hypothetical protein
LMGQAKTASVLFTGNKLVSFGCPIKRCIEHSKKMSEINISCIACCLYCGKTRENFAKWSIKKQGDSIPNF